MIEKEEFLAEGKRGVVYQAEYDGKGVIVKEKHPDSTAMGTLKNEYRFLEELNEYGIGPEVIELRDDKLIMEKIRGEMIIDYLEKNERDDIRIVLGKVFDKLRKMDELNVNKGEMTYPYKHIIVNDTEPRMIDFERCRKTESPQNITQFCQFIVSNRIKGILEDKGFDYEREEVLKAAKDYKDSYSEEDYENILEVIGL